MLVSPYFHFVLAYQRTANKKRRIGYTSTAATGLQKKVLEGSNVFKIHVRVLGNVLYLMASQTSGKETLKSIEALLLKELK